MQFTRQTKIRNSNTVYVIQDIPGTKIGAPKINIIGATQYGQLKVLLPENSQIILSPNYVVSTLNVKLKIIHLKIIYYLQAILQLLELRVLSFLI
jgi:hypothetical protein